MNKQNQSIRRMVIAAMIAAVYCAVSISMLPLSFGAVQVRVAEALTLLPVFSPVAIWGVTLGCALTNAIGFATGANIIGVLDIFFGTAATLIAALLSYQMRNIRFGGLPVLSSIPPVLLNAVVIGGELTYVMSGGFQPQIFLINALQVGAGQMLSCCVLGLPLIWLFQRNGVDKKLFQTI
ncbi:QueT transporter family protein [Oscillospiraceae bacterium PP1C4]